MNTRFPLLFAACALALVGCSSKSPSTEVTTAPAPETTAAPVTESAPAANPAPAATAAPTPAPVEPAPAAATPPTATAPTAPDSDKAAAGSAGCATEIAATDTIQYSVKSITVPTSCTDFKITLKHAGKLPVVAMGHNVVITKLADMPAVIAGGMAAGANNDYVKPGDTRVIAHTKLVGGGETTSVSFAVNRIKDDGPYEFFCSFPGHAATMKGSIAVK